MVEMMRRSLNAVAGCLIFLFVYATMASAAVVAPKQASPAKPATTIALLPHSSPSKDMLYATGEGAMPNVKEQPNRAKAYLQAKSYAKMQAVASLVQEAKGTMISYSSNGQHYVAETVIKQKIEGVIDCIQVVSAKKRPEGKDTIVEVTVRAPKPVPPKAPPAPKVEKVAFALDKASKVPSWALPMGQGPFCESSGGYTSVVIDAQGVGVCRSMSPKIVRKDGSEVWGTINVDPAFVTDHGIVAYARSRSEAISNKRAGANPLIIRARARGASRARCDVVISDSDADTLIAEDRRSRFLGDFRVIVITEGR